LDSRSTAIVLQNLPDTPAGERYNQLAEAPLNEIQDTLFQNYGDYHQSRNLAMALHNLHQGNSQPRAYVLKWDTQLCPHPSRRQAQGFHGGELFH
jgi:hypothetical protein